MMDVPREIWLIILDYIVAVNDLKSTSLVSQLFRSLVISKLWRAPKLKPDIKPEELAQLKHLPVEELDLPSADVDYIESISEITQLTSLKLGHTSNSIMLESGSADASVQRLSQLANLRCLHLPAAYGMTTEGLGYLTHLPIEDLHIGMGFGFSQGSVKIINKMDKLVTLCLGPTNDEGLSHLSKLKNLKNIDISLSDITTHGLENIRSMRIEVLNVSDCRLGDSCVDILSEMKTLRELYIDGNLISNAAIEKLQSVMPELKVLAGNQYSDDWSSDSSETDQDSQSD